MCEKIIDKTEKEEKLIRDSIKKRGWSDKMINELLPTPESIRKPNGKVKYCLWRLKDVEDAETTPLFHNMQESYLKRKVSADRAVATKTESFMTEVDLAISKIRVKYIPPKQLLNETISAKQQWYTTIGNWDIINVSTLDLDTLHRWEVNYIRHNLTAYDENLYNFKGRVGVREGYLKYRGAVMEAIEKVYPELFPLKEKYGALSLEKIELPKQ